MTPQEIAAVVREELKQRNLTPFRAARNARLPENAIRTVLDGHEPRVGRLEAICQSLGLELYIGPRGREADPRDPPAAQSLQAHWGSTEIPVRGWRHYSDEGLLSEPESEGVALAPAGLSDPDAFYAHMAGHSMVPENIGRGYYCLISPNTPLDAGQRVWLRNRQDQEVIRRIVAIDADAYSLRGWREPREPVVFERVPQDRVKDRWPRIDVAAKGVVLIAYAHPPKPDAAPPKVPDMAAARAPGRVRAVPVADPELAVLLETLVDHHEALNQYGRAQFVTDLKHHFPLLNRAESPTAAKASSGST